MAQRQNRTVLSAAHRSGVGIRLPRRHHDSLFLRQGRQKAGRICLVRAKQRVQVSEGRQKEAQSLGTLRHVRQRHRTVEPRYQALSPRRPRGFLGRRSGPMPQRGPARLGPDLENDRPAVAEKRLVLHRRAVGGLPHRPPAKNPAAGGVAKILDKRRRKRLTRFQLPSSISHLPSPICQLPKKSQIPNFKPPNMKEPMQQQPAKPSSAVSRRQFIKTSSFAAAGAGLLASSGDAAPESSSASKTPGIPPIRSKQPIRAVVIGLGGRGGGAGRDFLEAAKWLGVDGQIVAVADLFAEQARRGKDNYGVPEDKCFSGFDAFKKALEVPGVNYAILATPPGFRPHHFKACIEAGKNVFMEKPVAVDGPGIRTVYAAAETAKQKNLKVAAGTQRRHRPSYIETVKRIHDGMIGDVTSLRAYWVNGGPIWHDGDKARYGQHVGDTVLEKQINHWYHYILLCGDHICEQHVHNLDIANWIMKDHPVKCWGMGARQQLGDKAGEIWDNFAIEYQYANGVRLHAYCGQIKRAWSSVSEACHGAKGASELHDGRNYIKTKDGKLWKPGEIKDDNGYVNEHRDLILAILNDSPLNEAKQVADSTLTAIMGREAAYSGAEVDWATMLHSKFTYGPDMLYQDCSRLEWGAFRTLQPPMPSQHAIFKQPPVVAGASA